MLNTDPTNSQASSSDLTLFINNIDPKISEEKLKSSLGNLGKIRYLKIVKQQERKSYAYVTFDRLDCVQKALDRAQYRKVGRYEIIIMTLANHARLKPEGKLFIKGLTKETETSDLHKFFEQISKKMYVSITTDEEGRHLSTGYVHFFNVLQARQALKNLQGQMLKGGKLELEKWLPQEQRKKQGPRNLFISNLEDLPKISLEEKYTDILASFGEIQSKRFYENSSSASVVYKSADAAQRAKNELNQREGCSNLRVEWWKIQEERARDAEEKRNRLYLNWLGFHVTKEILKEKFEQFGKILSLDLKTSNTTWKNRKTQYAVIAYASEEETDKAYDESRQIEDIISFFVSRVHVHIDYFNSHRKEYELEEPIQTQPPQVILHYVIYPQNLPSSQGNFQSFQPSWPYLLPAEPPGIFENGLHVSNQNQNMYQKKNFKKNPYKEECKVDYEKPEMSFQKVSKENLDLSSFYENSGDISGMSLSNENEARHNDTYSFEIAKQNNLLKKNLNMGNLESKKGSTKFAREKY